MWFMIKSFCDVFQARMINVIIGFITIFIVVFTMISAFVFNKNSSRGLNITFAVIIAMICTSHLLLVSYIKCSPLLYV